MNRYELNGHMVFDFTATNGVTYAVKADLYLHGEVHLHRVFDPKTGEQLFPLEHRRFSPLVALIQATLWQLCPQDGDFSSGNFADCEV